MVDSAALVAEIQALPMPGAALEHVQSLAARLSQASDLPGMKLHIRVIGSITADYLTEILRLDLLRRGIAAQFELAPFGTLVPSLMQATASPAVDLALLLPSHRDLLHIPQPGATAAAAQAAVEREIAFWSGLISRLQLPALLLGFDQPGQRILGERDGLLPGGRLWHIRMTNLGLAAALPPNVTMVDTESLQSRVGLARWPDARTWQMCKQPFAMEALPEIATTLGASIAAVTGRARKVLVLDLDNTLWGGVVGDDGVEGIELGTETAEGEAFLAVQDYALRLQRRGVLLAVCSKNRDAAARAPFREHPAMILREDDIACFVANFDDKPANLRRIAQTLNLGIDSLVFVDDNPIERALVRQALPEVLVVELPEDPADYVAAIEAVQAFPIRELTREDLERATSYRALAEAATLRDNATDIEGFLSGLQPVLHVDRTDASALARVAQLLAKTNQFRLNATRFDEAALRARPRDILALRLADRLQDYGIVAVAILARSADTLVIENWVMSCRVFARRLEHATMELIRSRAREAGLNHIALDYVATEKNVILPPILHELGFTTQNGVRFTTTPEAPETHPHHMRLHDHSSEEPAHAG